MKSTREPRLASARVLSARDASVSDGLVAGPTRRVALPESDVAAFVSRTTRESGVPFFVEDLATIDVIVRVLAS